MGGGRCLRDDSLHSPFHPHELALHRPRICLSAHGSCAIGPECPVTGSGHQNTQTTKPSRNQPLTQSLAIERGYDSPTSGHSRSPIRFLQAPSGDGHSFLAPAFRASGRVWGRGVVSSHLEILHCCVIPLRAVADRRARLLLLIPTPTPVNL